MIKDKDIREYLHKNELSTFKKDPNSIVIDELSVCQGEARVDVAVVNGYLHGYEIKSERDTLSRLPGQQEVYNRTFDLLTLVISSSHLKKARKIIPNFWGIIEVKNEKGLPSFVKIRSPKKNKKIDSFSVAQLLWKNEALDILVQKGHAKGMKSKPKLILWNKLTDIMSTDELTGIVRSKLKERKNWKSD